MTQEYPEMLAACGLDCGPCPIRLIPIDEKAAQGVINWFKEMGWLKENEGIKEAIERKMFCNGCQGDRDTHWSANCQIMLCCVDEKHKQHCGQCPELLTCEKLERFASDGPEHHTNAVNSLRERFGKS
jgi:hypothetical protein